MNAVNFTRGRLAAILPLSDEDEMFKAQNPKAQNSCCKIFMSLSRKFRLSLSVLNAKDEQLFRRVWVLCVVSSRSRGASSIHCAPEIHHSYSSPPKTTLWSEGGCKWKQRKSQSCIFLFCLHCWLCVSHDVAFVCAFHTILLCHFPTQNIM